MLELRERAANPNNTASSDQLSQVSSLRVVVNTIRSAIVEEFGGPLYHTSHELQLANNAVDITLGTVHASTTATESKERPVGVENGVIA